MTPAEAAEPLNCQRRVLALGAGPLVRARGIPGARREQEPEFKKYGRVSVVVEGAVATPRLHREWGHPL